MDNPIYPGLDETQGAGQVKASTLTPEEVLDVAVDKSSQKSIGPTGESVLSAESNRPGPITNREVSIKNSPIDSVTEPEINPDVSARRSEAVAVSSGIASGRSLEEVGAKSPTVSNAVTNSNSVVNNTNVSNVTDQSKKSSDTYEGDFTQIINQYYQSFSERSVPDVTVKTSGADAIKSIPNVKPGEKANLTASAKPEEVLKAQEASTESAASEMTPSMEFMTIYNNFQEQVKSGSLIDNTFNSSTSNVNVKNKSIMEPGTIQKSISPDRTVEQAVQTQTKTLNESINNLTTNISNISPSSQSSVVNNAGNTMNQTTINAGQTQQPQVQRIIESVPRPEVEQKANNSDFYLQAIYAALMSGKVKVKLEYQ